MKNILVTGNAGHLGRHACKALAQAGDTPVALASIHFAGSDHVGESASAAYDPGNPAIPAGAATSTRCGPDWSKRFSSLYSMLEPAWNWHQLLPTKRW